MPEPSGRWVPISPPRRFIGDLVHFSRRAPPTTMQRTTRLAAVAEGRRRTRPRIGWCALFVKVYAFVAARRAPLRLRREAVVELRPLAGRWYRV